MRVVYVAGPFRAANGWEIEQNVRVAEALALKAWKEGVAVICPHANTRFYQGAAPDQIWLEGDLELVWRVDAVLCTPNWERSTGAREEVKLAQSLHKPIFQSYWIDGEPTLPALFLAWIHKS